MKKIKITDIYFSNETGNTRIFIVGYDIETGEIIKWQHFTKALYKSSELPEINTIVEIF